MAETISSNSPKFVEQNITNYVGQTENSDLLFKDPRVQEAQKLFAESQLEPIFFSSVLSELLKNPKDFKNLTDFQAIYQNYGLPPGSFKETFQEFAIDQTVKKGKFDVSSLNDFNEYVQEKKLSNQSAQNLASKVDTTGDVENEETNPFTVLYRLLDLLIESNNLILALSYSYAKVLETETAKQRVYLEVQESLRPLTREVGWLEDVDDDDAQEALDLFNQTILPSYQQRNDSYMQISDANSKELSSMVSELNNASSRTSDLFSSFISTISSCASMIFR